MIIPIFCINVEDAKKLVGAKFLLEGREVELIRITSTSTTVKHQDGSFQKTVWNKLELIERAT